MSRIKRFTSSGILRMIYNSLVLPHLYYVILAWGFNNNRILKLQKRAVRIISKAKYNAHTEPLFKNLMLLKIQDIFTLQCCKFYYKQTRDQLPAYFRNFFDRNIDMHSYTTRIQDDVHLHHFRTETSRKCIRFSIPNLINNLPVLVTEKVATHSLGGFAHYLKLHLIGKYQTECLIRHCYVCARQ